MKIERKLSTYVQLRAASGVNEKEEEHFQCHAAESGAEPEQNLVPVLMFSRQLRLELLLLVKICDYK